MSSQLRQQDMKVTFTVDGVEQVVKLKRAVGELDNYTGDLAKTLGVTDVKLTDVTTSQNKLNSIVRASITQTNKQNKVIEQLSAEYAHASAMVGQSAEKQQKLNAIYRLGTNATLSQKKAVISLVQAHQAHVASSSTTQRSMRNTRGIAQNLGWQLQDTAVQFGMLGFNAKSAMLIISQQGSQMASSFGAKGALVGAVIAIGGALGGVVYQAVTGTKSNKELAESQKLVNTVFEDGAVDASSLTEKYKKLYSVNKDLALLTARKGMWAAKDQMKEARTEIKALAQEHFKFGEMSGIVLDKNTGDWTHRNDIMSASGEKEIKELGISADTYNELYALQAKGAYKAIANRVVEIALAGKANKKLTDMGFAYAEISQKAKDAAKRMVETQKIFAGEVTPDAPSSSKSSSGESDISRAFKSEYDSLIGQTETIEQEYARRKGYIDSYVTEVGEVNIEAAVAYEKLEELKTAELDDELNKRNALELKATAEINAEKEKFLSSVEKGQAKPKSPQIKLDTDYNLNMQKLAYLEEEAMLLDHYAEVSRIQDLMVGEKQKYQDASDAISTAGIQAQMQSSATFLNGMTGIMGQLTSIAQDGSKESEALFYATQAIAFATTLVNTEMAATAAGAKAATLTGVAGFLASEGVVRAMGYASAGIIAGTTIAGAFDTGGTIPQGQYGVVSEYGDELVDGVLVKGKTGGSRVTSRKDTSDIINDNSTGGGVTIVQHITVSGSGDKALAQAMQTAATKGAEMGSKKAYSMVANDFSTGRGIRKTLKKSIGG